MQHNICKQLILFSWLFSSKFVYLYYITFEKKTNRIKYANISQNHSKTDKKRQKSCLFYNCKSCVNILLLLRFFELEKNNKKMLHFILKCSSPMIKHITLHHKQHQIFFDNCSSLRLFCLLMQFHLYKNKLSGCLKS